MAALTCDICGGNLAMNESGEFAVCESCGMKHTKERVKNKVQEVKGVVEITKGEAEKNRLLDNANAFIKFGELEKAEGVLQELINNYPNDIKCRLFYVKYLFLRLDPRFSKLDYEECTLPPKTSLAYNSLLGEIEKAKRLDIQCVSGIKNMWQEHDLRNTSYIEELTKNKYPLHAVWDLIMLDHEKLGGIHSSEICKARIGTIINEYRATANELLKNCHSSKLINILFSANLCFRPEYDPYISKKYELKELKKEGRDWFYKGFSTKEYIDRIISIDYLSQTEAICFVHFCDPEVCWAEKQIYVRFTNPYIVDELAALMNSTCTPTEQKQAEQETIRSNRRSKRLCQHCGGTFEGSLFKKICSKCGKPKDY